jgi:hypothetical protein
VNRYRNFIGVWELPVDCFLVFPGQFCVDAVDHVAVLGAGGDETGIGIVRQERSGKVCTILYQGGIDVNELPCIRNSFVPASHAKSQIKGVSHRAKSFSAGTADADYEEGPEHDVSLCCGGC